MKKLVAFWLFSFIVTTYAWAAAEAMGPDAMRHQRRAELIAKRKAEGPSSAPVASAKPKENTFWDKEGKRSGMDRFGERMGNIFKAMNPAPFFQEQEHRYNERKGASQTK